MKNLYRGEVFYLIASPLDHVEAYRYFEDGELAVVDGKIVEAGPFEAMRSRYPDFPVTDYSGKLITPGFIDSHIHFCMASNFWIGWTNIRFPPRKLSLPWNMHKISLAFS